MEQIARKICKACNRSFGRNADLTKHVKAFHNEQIEEILEVAPVTKIQIPFCCKYCSKNFSQQRSLYMHLRCHETREIVLKKVAKKCTMCDYVGNFRNDFYMHFKTMHDIEIETEDIHINVEEFVNWKNDFEKKTNSKFVLECGSSGKIVRYACHRSGFFRSKGKGTRHIKTQGPNRINGFCPASIKTIEQEGKITIKLVKTHIGHQNDIGHLSLTSLERQSLAAKIASKIPFNAILDEIRDSVPCEPMQRLHLLTRKDLHNIESSFNLQSTAVRHKNDAMSIESGVNEMKNTCVVLYKPQGIILDEYRQLKLDDFMLVIMNDGQQTDVTTGNNELVIHLDSKNIQSEATFENIRKSNLKNTRRLPLNEKKKLMLEQFTTILNKINREEELEAVQKLMNSLMPTLDAMQGSCVFNQVNNEPYKMKIDQQRRLFSTRKKINKRKSHLTKPNEQETNT